MKKKAQTNGGNLITNYTIPKDVVRKSNENKQNKRKKSSSQYHESSIEAEGPVQNHSDHTELIASENQFGITEQRKQQNQQRVPEVCYQMIMIAPYDTTYYAGFKRRTKTLIENYNKEATIKYILQNCKFEKISNLKILQKIDDEQFWKYTMPTILQYAHEDKKQKAISSCIRMLIPNSSEVQALRKSQILMIIINMFLCIMPKQSNRKSNIFTMSHLMSAEQSSDQKTNSIKLQKLKCIINYIKISLKRKWSTLVSNNVQIQRACSPTMGGEVQEFQQIQYRLKEVDIIDGIVQHGYKYGIMIDFANKNIGGGVLNRGAVQEEILFACFTELIVACIIGFQLRQGEALVVYGAERFSVYDGYSETFKFVGDYEASDKDIGPFESIIVIIDAYQFRSVEQKTYNQYQPYYIHRQIKKFLCGIQASDYNADESMRVYTGKWGCGAFGGDPMLKFVIQWIACSVANKNMTFTSKSEEERKQLNILVRFCSKFDTLELLQIIEQFNYYGQSRKQSMCFLDFIKKYAG